MHGSRKTLTYSPTTVTWNGRNVNRLVQDRLPEYGMGTTKGCVVERQFSLEIVTQDHKSITGVIKDSETDAHVDFAIVTFFESRQIDTLEAIDGKFTHTIHDELQRLEVRGLGYHPLVFKIPKRW